VLRLIPKEEKFYEMFIKAGNNINAAAKLLKQMLETSETTEQYARKIKELEHLGDKLTHEIISKLNKTFVTPFDREDIYTLCRALDDILDYINSVANWIVLFRITTPGPDAIRLAQIIIECTEEISKAIGSLHQLNTVYPHCVEINRLENEADTVFRQALVWLFESTRDAITIIKLKDFFQDLELATDRCEDVANVLESIAVKNQ